MEAQLGHRRILAGQGREVTFGPMPRLAVVSTWTWEDAPQEERRRLESIDAQLDSRTTRRHMKKDEAYAVMQRAEARKSRS